MLTVSVAKTHPVAGIVGSDYSDPAMLQKSPYAKRFCRSAARSTGAVAGVLSSS